MPNNSSIYSWLYAGAFLVLYLEDNCSPFLQRLFITTLCAAIPPAAGWTWGRLRSFWPSSNPPGQNSATVSQILNQMFFPVVPIGNWLITRVGGMCSQVLATPEILPALDYQDTQLQEFREAVAVYKEMLAKSPSERVREINALVTTCEELDIDLNGQIDPDWICPILHRVMADPVKVPDGHCYERMVLQNWYEGGARRAILNERLALPNPRGMPTEIGLQVRISRRLSAILAAHDAENGAGPAEQSHNVA